MNDNTKIIYNFARMYEYVNSAYWDGVISEKHANHLREKYLAGAF